MKYEFDTDEISLRKPFKFNMIKDISERIAYFLRKQEILKQKQIRIKWNKWIGNKLEISEIKNSHCSNLNL